MTTSDILQIRLTAEKRNGTMRVNIPASLYRKYAEHCRKISGHDISEGNIAVFFSLPITHQGLDIVCKKIKSGEKPMPIIINFDKENHFYK